MDFHVCSEGERCAGDEDEDMDGQDKSVICKQCVEAKSPKVWCSEQCAYANMPRHLEENHGKKGPMEDVRTLISTFKEVMTKTLEEANPGVKFQSLQ